MLDPWTTTQTPLRRPCVPHLLNKVFSFLYCLWLHESVVFSAQWSSFNMENRRHNILWLCYGLLGTEGSFILSLFSQGKTLHIIFLCCAAYEEHLPDFSGIHLQCAIRYSQYFHHNQNADVPDQLSLCLSQLNWTMGCFLVLQWQRWSSVQTAQAQPISRDLS